MVLRTILALILGNNHYQTAEGQELSNVQIDSSFDPSAPDFLKNIQDPILRGWVVEVISYWSDLIRSVFWRIRASAALELLTLFFQRDQ